MISSHCMNNIQLAKHAVIWLSLKKLWIFEILLTLSYLSTLNFLISFSISTLVIAVSSSDCCLIATTMFSFCVRMSSNNFGAHHYCYAPSLFLSDTTSCGNRTPSRLLGARETGAPWFLGRKTLDPWCTLGHPLFVEWPPPAKVPLRSYSIQKRTRHPGVMSCAWNYIDFITVFADPINGIF